MCLIVTCEPQFSEALTFPRVSVLFLLIFLVVVVSKYAHIRFDHISLSLASTLIGS